MVSDLFLVRHGAAQQDTGWVYNVLPGPPLVEQGCEEAERAAAFLVGQPIAQIIASPFARTTQTAEHLAARLGVPLSFSPLLVESGPDEDAAVIRARILLFLSELLVSPAACVSIVSHGFPIKMLLLELSRDQVDLSRHVYDYGNPAPTGGIWQARRDAGGWQVVLVLPPR